jgi:hypothetical protein
MNHISSMEKWMPSEVAPPMANLTGQMCVPTLQFNVGAGQDIDWVLSVVAAGVGSTGFASFRDRPEVPIAVPT